MFFPFTQASSCIFWDNLNPELSDSHILALMKKKKNRIWHMCTLNTWFMSTCCLHLPSWKIYFYTCTLRSAPGLSAPLQKSMLFLRPLFLSLFLSPSSLTLSLSYLLPSFLSISLSFKNKHKSQE